VISELNLLFSSLGSYDLQNAKIGLLSKTLCAITNCAPSSSSLVLGPETPEQEQCGDPSRVAKASDAL
jgi:hypothetical protein